MKKKRQSIILLVLVMLTSMCLTSNVSAGGQINNFYTSLATSGGGGSWSTRQNINSGVYFNACGRVTFTVNHIVNYGSWTSNTWKWNYSTFSISNVSGKVSGGVGFTGNYESSAYNKYDYTYFGDQIFSGTTYRYNWNRSMPLGPVNKQAHYDISIKSGFPNPGILCDNEARVIFGVGKTSGRSFTEVESAIPEEFSKNTIELSKYLGKEYNGETKMFGKKASVSHFESENQNTVLLTQQEDTPININNINDNEFISKNISNFEYEIGNFKTAGGTDMNVIRFKKNKLYMALVTNLTEGEALKIIEIL